jgi:hypothetical protein
MPCIGWEQADFFKKGRILGNVSPYGPCRPILLRDTTKEYGREEDGVSNIQSATVYLPSLVLSSTYPPP